MGYGLCNQQASLLRNPGLRIKEKECGPLSDVLPTLSDTKALPLFSPRTHPDAYGRAFPPLSVVLPTLPNTRTGSERQQRLPGFWEETGGLQQVRPLEQS